MTKKTKLFIILFIISKAGIFASPQMPDFIIYGKDTIPTYNLILENYLQKQDTAKTNSLFGLNFRNNASPNCWRGYQAIYKIVNDSLFLVHIIDCGQLRNRKIDTIQSQNKIKNIFNENFKDGKVYIDWFDGTINFPLTNKTLRWDGVFYKIFEKEKVITVTNGLITKTEDVDNYFDDPKRIDRRDKKLISNILFKKLKNSLKNTKGFDCGTEYLITIDENGNVSKIKMLYTEKEIEKYFDKGEYSFCIDKMYKSLKPLRFDILKNKGIPISEEIYLSIFIDVDGKIENRTN